MGVNLFALITGYCGYQSNFKAKKIISIMATVTVYSYVALALTLVFFPESLTIEKLLDFIFPIGRGTYWYISAYFIFMILKPFIDYCVRSLNDTMLKRLLILLTVILSVIPTLCFYANANVTNTIWIIYMYILGVSIRRMGKEKFSFKIIQNDLLIFFVIYMLIVISQVVIKCCGIPGIAVHSQYFSAMYSIPMLLASLFLFKFFIGLRIGVMTDFFQRIGKYSFDIYILHTSIFIKTILYEYNNEFERLCEWGGYYWIRFIGLGLAIYFVCLIIGICFQYILKMILSKEKVLKYMDKMDNYFNGMYPRRGYL